MKYFKIILIGIITFMSIDSFAQETLYEKDKPVPPLLPPSISVKQGDFIIDAFYGFPYLNSIVVRAFFIDSLNSIVHNYNTFGAKFEYMISDKIGLGVEATYSLATDTYQGTTNNFYQGQIGTGKYYTAGYAKLRVLGKMNFHFGTTKNFDPYFTIGAGYKNIDLYSNEPGATTNGLSKTLYLFPIAVRIGIGFRYYFSEKVGLNAELGIGGPIMQTGLSFKI